MRDYRKIKAFQLADNLIKDIYVLIKKFPKEENYGLSSQLRRAAVSVAANIVEGASRQHKRDYLNFLYIARASLAESEYLLHLAHRLGYLSDQTHTKIEQTAKETARTLFGLIEAVSKEASTQKLSSTRI